MTRIIFYVSFNTPIPPRPTNQQGAVQGGPGVLKRVVPLPKPGIYGSTIPCITLSWDDALPASSIVSAINVGAYHFPLLPEPGPVFAIQHGDLVYVARPAGSPHPEMRLTQREREVLTMLAEGQSLQQIGYLLHIKPRTVTGHLTHLKNRLQAGSREQLVARGIALGLYRPSLPEDPKRP